MGFLFLCNNFLSKLFTNRRSMNFRLFFFLSAAICSYKSSFIPSNISLMFCLHKTSKKKTPVGKKKKKTKPENQPIKQTNHCSFHLNLTPMVRNAAVHVAAEMCAVHNSSLPFSPHVGLFVTLIILLYTPLLPPPCPVTYLSLSLPLLLLHTLLF